MSDFDTVLERLLSDRAFAAQLAGDPQRPLAGYELSAQERELLRSELVTGSGGQSQVEDRTTKSGVVGLIGPVAAAFAVAATSSPGLGSGHVPKVGSLAGTQPSGRETFGTEAGAAGRQVMGSAPPPGSESFGSAGEITETLGVVDSVGSGVASMGEAPVPAVGYHTVVDVDGDGTWDAHTAFERGDGGVDIHVDVDGDGRVDFVGHDYDRDGLVDVAEFDNDRDGVLETRMYDDTGDGWMDRAERLPPVGPG